MASPQHQSVIVAQQPAKADVVQPNECAPPAGASCDPVSQCNCSGGTKCSISPQGGIGCVPAGSHLPGQWCATDSDCAPGSLCETSLTIGAQRCSAFCRQPFADGCEVEGQGSRCWWSISTVAGQPPSAYMCTYPCFPFAAPGTQGSCDNNESCRFFLAQFGTQFTLDYANGYGYCAPGGSFVEGSGCAPGQDGCVDGLICFPTTPDAQQGQCRIPCDGFHGCPNGRVCQTLPGTVNGLGLCG